MPIFEYRCRGCGVRYEALVTGAGQASPACPRCGAEDVERLLSAFAVGRTPGGSPGPGPCGSHGCACRDHL